MSGPPPKPPHLEVIEGRPGKRKLRHAIEAPTPPQVPEPPAYLSGHALAVWSELAGELHKLGLLTPLDVSVFATYCDAVGRWRTACEVLEAMPKDERYTTSAGRTLLRIERMAADQMLRLGSQFGLSPMSRLRLAVPPPRPPSRVMNSRRLIREPRWPAFAAWPAALRRLAPPATLAQRPTLN